MERVLRVLLLGLKLSGHLTTTECRQFYELFLWGNTGCTSRVVEFDNAVGTTTTPEDILWRADKFRLNEDAYDGQYQYGDKKRLALLLKSSAAPLIIVVKTFYLLCKNCYTTDNQPSGILVFCLNNHVIRKERGKGPTTNNLEQWRSTRRTFLEPWTYRTNSIIPPTASRQ